MAGWLGSVVKGSTKKDLKETMGKTLPAQNSAGKKMATGKLSSKVCK